MNKVFSYLKPILNIAIAFAAALAICLPAAAQVSQEALDSISTPDQVETSIGILEFFDGIPTQETAERLYDNLDFLRGVETFLNGIPAGSVDLYFGPEAPAGKETNWTQTVPGKGWFVLIRLYGPLEPWFDGTWLPGEFELVK